MDFFDLSWLIIKTSGLFFITVTVLAVIFQYCCETRVKRDLTWYYEEVEIRRAEKLIQQKEYKRLQIELKKRNKMITPRRPL